MIYMNFYVCSTVRHLLFSVLKSASEHEQENIIFMIIDQQDILPSSFNIHSLPQKTNVIFIERKEINNKLYFSFTDKLTKVIINNQIPLNEAIRKTLSNRFFFNVLDYPIHFDKISSGNLFLFNDRNKISRIFKSIFSDYSLIEEGLANYASKELKINEKIIRCLTNSKIKKRYFGDSRYCKSIYLLHPEKAPEDITQKVKPFTFINPDVISQYCIGFFKIPDDKVPNYLLATQPIEKKELIFEVYDRIIKHCQNHSIQISIKPHPAEDINQYAKAFPNISIIDNKVPIELIIFGSTEKTNILSIFSTAGIGFEKYCERTNLIKDHELQQIDSILQEWEMDINTLNTRINALLGD